MCPANNAGFFVVEFCLLQFFLLQLLLYDFITNCLLSDGSVVVKSRHSDTMDVQTCLVSKYGRLRDLC